MELPLILLMLGHTAETFGKRNVAWICKRAEESHSPVGIIQKSGYYLYGAVNIHPLQSSVARGCCIAWMWMMVWSTKAEVP